MERIFFTCLQKLNIEGFIMKIINFTILILTVLTIYSFAQTKKSYTTHSYYPLTIGNTWNYDYGVPDSGFAFTRTITDTINYISHNYYVIEKAYCIYSPTGYISLAELWIMSKRTGKTMFYLIGVLPPLGMDELTTIIYSLKPMDEVFKEE